MILLAGLSLRLFGLGHGSLWHDEAFTGLVSPLPWGRFWAALLGDVHPPLWYLIERGVLATLGRSDVALRLPAALCSAAALVWFYWLLFSYGSIRIRCLERIQHYGAGLEFEPALTHPVKCAALALMALSPFQIYYAQEARMYAALTLCAVMMLDGIMLGRDWTFVLGALGALWLHNLGALIVAAGLLAMVLRRGIGPVMAHRWLPGALILLGGPAFAWTIYQTTRVTGGGYWILDRSVGSWLYNTVFCSMMGQGVIDSRLSWHASTISLVVLIGGSLLVWRQRRHWLLLLAWLPGLLALLVSNLVQPILLARTLIGATPALYLVAGHTFDTRRRRWALALCLIPVMFSGLYRHYGLERRGNVRPLVTRIEAEQPAAVMHSQTGAWILMAWQMPGYHHLLWNGAAHGLGNAISDQTGDALEMERVSLQDAPRPLAVVYADYVLVSPEDRATILTELRAAGAERTYTLADDEVQKIDLWMLR